ncbi:Retrotransposable element Tf2 protein type 1, partial [Stegodyphus mimosarum]
MPFGLGGAPATFKKVMDIILRPVLGKSTVIYLDDVIVTSETIDEHVKHLEEAGLKINPKKCEFAAKELRLIVAISIYVVCYCNVRAAHILAPLVKFLEGHTNKKKHPRSKASAEQIQWEDEATLSFNASNEDIATATLLRHPMPGAQLSLWADAPDVALGGSLMQLVKQREPIGFYSAKLSKSQRNWATYDRELYAMYSSVKKFKHTLEGRKCVFYTDQKTP